MANSFIYVQTFVFLFRAFGFSKSIKCVLNKIVSDIAGRIAKTNVVKVHGFMMSLIPHDEGISRELKVFKLHEPLATRILIAELKKGMAVVDIGSNIGYYCLLEAKLVGPKGRVLAIEPNPIAYEHLYQNIKMNSLGNVMAENEAVWDKNSTVMFLMSKQSNLSKVVETRNNLGNHCWEQIINVPARCLDDITKDLGKVDFLRMDLEGGEYKLFEGSKQTLGRFYPVIFMELHIPTLGKKRSKAILQGLKRYGYTIKYLIHRRIDLPLVASPGDIRVDVNIEDLILHLPPLDLLLFLTPNIKTEVRK